MHSQYEKAGSPFEPCGLEGAIRESTADCAFFVGTESLRSSIKPSADACLCFSIYQLPWRVARNSEGSIRVVREHACNMVRVALQRANG